MNLNQLIRKEQVQVTTRFLGDAGFGPREVRPDGNSKVCVVWSAGESPFLSSKVYSTYSIWHLNPEFPQFVEKLATLLNDSHRACWHGSSFKMQPTFWVYPFVKYGDYDLDQRGTFAIEATHKIHMAAQDLIFKTEMGEEFLKAVFLQFSLNKIIPLSYRVPKPLSRNYVLLNSDVWSSEFELSADQWQSAISQLKEQRKKEVDDLLQGLNRKPAPMARLKLSEAVRSEVWRRDMGRCVQCESNERLEFDHIIPLSRGGSDTARNLQLLCEPCNRKKAGSI